MSRGSDIFSVAVSLDGLKRNRGLYNEALEKECPVIEKSPGGGKGMSENLNRSIGKEEPIDDVFCHCYEYTKKDIEQDYRKNKQSTILEKIAAEKKAELCNRARKNPKA